LYRRRTPLTAQLHLLKARQKIGKYRILGRIASGPLADVYRAYDTIQKQRVALKMPKADAYSGQEEFLHEVQVATRLQHPNILHEHNIIHCDIKPENYILFPGNQLKLCDFGFAKISLRTLKASGSGTIDYIAPEQAMGCSRSGLSCTAFCRASYRSGRSPGRW
jgi:serine/threonine-protein kinase